MSVHPPQAPTDDGIRFGLAGKVCIVTGGAQGIGAACVRRFAREGALPVIADIDAARGSALARALGAAFVQCDVGDKAQVQALIGSTLALHGRIDVLVNNAGIFRAADFLQTTEEDWDAVLRVNLKGAFLVGQAVARIMVGQALGGFADRASREGLGDRASRGEGFADRASRGAIINMSSVNGRLAIPNIASYNASKGAIDQLTRAMALALAPHRIRVNAVAPGTIATELAEQAVLTSDEARERIMGRTPMRRLGTPEEVADVTAFLASDAASYLTGEIVVADGGRMALNYTMPA